MTVISKTNHVCITDTFMDLMKVFNQRQNQKVLEEGKINVIYALFQF